ncbi:MAG: aminotransferase class I/II-fold pyridoxal phosphate-dependent enzyme [Desulfomicrobium sp.]|nr:aminotransferase class I/II-fold pyridoxal phosphate-dependent enzyme [Desulfomicrobium sp.]
MIAPKFRTLPPSAAPLHGRDILAGIRALGRPHEAAEEFRQSIQKKFGVRHVFFTTSGRAGLSAGLRALRRLNPDRDEVLLPAYTSFSVPSAVVNAGLRVSLYDLHPETLAPDLDSLAAALTPNTLCVVACHLFGYPLDLDPLRELCRAGGAALFDDAAQAMGASIGGKLAGTMGDVGLFSLSRGKNMTAVDGGIVLTDRDDVAEGLAALVPEPAGFSARHVAQSLMLLAMLHPRAYWLPASLPFLNIGASVFDPVFPMESMDSWRTGLAGSVLERLDALNAGRKNVAASLLSKLDKMDGVRAIRPLPEAEPVFLRLPLLPEKGVWPHGRVPEISEMGVVRSYPLALQDIASLKPHLAGSGNCPVAALLAENLLTLPTHSFVQDADLMAMTGILKEISETVENTTNWLPGCSVQTIMENKA